MTADLPPDVQDRAAQAASDARQKYDNEHLSCNDHVRMLAVVDAVVSVVAPEIERPLQARITELEKTLSDNRKLWDESIAQTGAALEQSRRIYAEFVTGQHEEALTRVELLTAALDTAIEALGWASDYVAVPWPKVYQVEPLRAALAAGVTESGDK